MTNTYCMCTLLRYSWWWTVDLSETLALIIRIHIYIYIDMDKQLLNFPALFSVCCGQSVTGTGLSPVTSSFPCQYRSAVAPSIQFSFHERSVMLPINNIFKPHLYVTSGRWKRDLCSSSKHYGRYVRLRILCIQSTCHEENCSELPSFENSYIWSERKIVLAVIYTVSPAAQKRYINI